MALCSQQIPLRRYRSLHALPYPDFNVLRCLLTTAISSAPTTRPLGFIVDTISLGREAHNFLSTGSASDATLIVPTMELIVPLTVVTLLQCAFLFGGRFYGILAAYLSGPILMQRQLIQDIASDLVQASTVFSAL